MSDLPESKCARYASLVSARKKCDACVGLKNQSICADGKYDKYVEIGAWSRWQGNLDAELMVVGQDWGDVDCFKKTEGRPIYGTNPTLVDLLQCAEIYIQPFDKTVGRGSLFFTNGILCLKQGGAQSAVKPQWFRQCGERFLRPLIEIVQPKTVVCLGNRAYRGLLSAYDGIKPRKLRDAVDSGEPQMLPSGIAVFVVYHCGKYVLNTHRCLTRQKEDWSRIGKYLKRRREAPKP